MGLTAKYGHRKKDNALSVYFSAEARQALEDLAKEYPGLKSRSKIVNIFFRYGLEHVRQNKALKAEVEKRLLTDL